ncbi:hypothetical protein H8B13_20055 [Hymenobacter sp. BT188]|uniref:PID-CTERM protein-sorting domain-containing protein n=1 Tax=Hymenobacter sp. BT188 TaxID=2763504 RepID=UPI0016510378|nr:hypothetical protein [Hymenobacter sp. BT188]MBC6609123.1 hypothetical protein [Hymenobacter sp. BT188]
MLLPCSATSLAQGNPNNGNNGNSGRNGNAEGSNPNNGNQGNDKPNGNAGGTGVPLDGGASLLLAAGAAYGLKKIRDTRRAGV